MGWFDLSAGAVTVTQTFKGLVHISQQLLVIGKICNQEYSISNKVQSNPYAKYTCICLTLRLCVALLKHFARLDLTLNVSMFNGTNTSQEEDKKIEKIRSVFQRLFHHSSFQ